MHTFDIAPPTKPNSVHRQNTDLHLEAHGISSSIIEGTIQYSYPANSIATIAMPKVDMYYLMVENRRESGDTKLEPQKTFDHSQTTRLGAS